MLIEKGGSPVLLISKLAQMKISSQSPTFPHHAHEKAAFQLGPMPIG